MSTEISFKFDSITIKESLDKKALDKAASRVLRLVSARHSKFYSSGATPDAKPQKNNRTLRKTGELLRSRQVVDDREGVALKFQGSHKTKGKGILSNADLARYLRKRGFDLHFFSDKDKKIVMETINKEFSKQLKNLVTTKKGV